MSNSPFAAPPAPGGGISWDKVKGSLVLVEVLATETGIQTQYGPADAVRANVVILDGDQKGEDYQDTLVFPKVLQSQLKARIGQKVLGRVAQGTVKPGTTQSPPWILTEATEDDIKVGTAHLSGQLSTPAGGGSAPPF